MRILPDPHLAKTLLGAASRANSSLISVINNGTAAHAEAKDMDFHWLVTLLETVMQTVMQVALQPVVGLALVLVVLLLCILWPFLGWFCKCGLRSCGCIKRCFRVTGWDKFDDFEVMFLVHEAVATSSSGKLNFCVRITSGRQTVQTAYRSNSIFQENLVLNVDQGSSVVKVELIDGWRRKIATLVFDPVRDIIEPKGCVERTFAMKTRGSGVISPKVKLTYRVQSHRDEESPAMAASSEDRNLDFLVSEQLRKVGWTEATSDPREQLLFLAKSCAGIVDRFGTFGEKVPTWLAIRGPPKHHRFSMGFWKSEREFDMDKAPWEEIDILRISGVKADPGRPEVFYLYYVDEQRVRQHVVVRRVDRTREVWVKLLTMFISEVHTLKQKAHSARHQG